VDAEIFDAILPIGHYRALADLLAFVSDWRVLNHENSLCSANGVRLAATMVRFMMWPRKETELVARSSIAPRRQRRLEQTQPDAGRQLRHREHKDQ
jgi:hypothetical protein